MNDIQLVLTSAVVSAIVSGSFTLWSQHLERKNRQLENDSARKARQDELLLTKAVEMALDEKKTFLEVMKTHKKGGIVPPDILSVAQLYRYLQSLLHEKSLPADLKATLRTQILAAANPKDPYIDELLKCKDLELTVQLPQPEIIQPASSSGSSQLVGNGKFNASGEQS